MELLAPRETEMIYGLRWKVVRRRNPKTYQIETERTLQYNERENCSPWEEFGWQDVEQVEVDEE